MDGVLAYVTLFAGNFAPRGWATCQGQLMAISGNTALFSLIGTFYGGNGKTTFALPDLQGRAIVGAGQAAGLSFYQLGQMGGSATTTLNPGQLAAHNHGVNLAIHPGSATNPGNANVPTNAVYAPLSSGAPAYSGSPSGNMQAYQVTMQTSVTGNSIPYNNRNPYLALTYIICLQGIFPARP